MKRMVLKRDGVCARCSTPVAAGVLAFWDSQRKVVVCTSCGEVLAPVDDPPLPPAKPDQAGGSAAKEYEKRSRRDFDKVEKLIEADAARRHERTTQRPILGAIANALTPRPMHGPEKQATTAWKTGAAGERRVAEVLESAAGVEVLHDRIRPGSKSANIDHIAVGPSGVFVIDAKQYTGTLEMRDKGSMFRPDERLYVGGRDQTKLAAGVLVQVEAVRLLMDEMWPQVPVSGVLCFVGAEWTRQKVKNVNGVVVIWPKGLPAHVGAPGPHAAHVEAIASHLRRTLKQAT